MGLSDFYFFALIALKNWKLLIYICTDNNCGYLRYKQGHLFTDSLKCRILNRNIHQKSKSSWMITQGITNHDMQYEFKQPLFDNRQKKISALYPFRSSLFDYHKIQLIDRHSLDRYTYRVILSCRLLCKRE